MSVEMPGIQIKQIREALGLSAAQFGVVLGVHPSTVHRWEAAGAALVSVDGVPANVLLSLRQKLESGKQAHRQAAVIGSDIERALLVGGALIALAALLAWLTGES